MAARVVLQSESATVGTTPTAERRYFIDGVADESDARAALTLVAPSTYTLAAGVTLSIDSLSVSENKGSTFDGVVHYAKVPPEEGTTWSFDTGGATEHITYARYGLTAATAPGGWTPFSFGGAISGIEGVDVVVPILNWQETHILPIETVTDAFVGVLFNLTGCVNLAAFRAFAAGEALFMGASGNSRGDGKVEVTYKFACQANATDLVIGDNEIVVPSKQGWQYLWVSYIDKEVPGGPGDAKKIVKIAQLASVETVYPSGNFNLLGI